MSIPKQKLHIDFSGGIEAGQDDRLSKPNTYANLINLRTERGGSVEKRKQEGSQVSYFTNFPVKAIAPDMAVVYDSNSPAVGTQLGTGYYHDTATGITAATGTYGNYLTSEIATESSNSTKLNICSASSSTGSAGFICTTWTSIPAVFDSSTPWAFYNIISKETGKVVATGSLSTTIYSATYCTLIGTKFVLIGGTSVYYIDVNDPNLTLTSVGTLSFTLKMGPTPLTLGCNRVLVQNNIIHLFQALPSGTTLKYHKISLSAGVPVLASVISQTLSFTPQLFAVCINGSGNFSFVFFSYDASTEHYEVRNINTLNSTVSTTTSNGYGFASEITIMTHPTDNTKLLMFGSRGANIHENNFFTANLSVTTGNFSPTGSFMSLKFGKRIMCYPKTVTSDLLFFFLSDDRFNLVNNRILSSVYGYIYKVSTGAMTLVTTNLNQELVGRQAIVAAGASWSLSDMFHLGAKPLASDDGIAVSRLKNVLDDLGTGFGTDNGPAFQYNGTDTNGNNPIVNEIVYLQPTMADSLPVDTAISTSRGNYFPGNLNLYRDKQNIIELGFRQPPEIVEVLSNGQSAPHGNGIIQFCAVYTYTDESGNVHRSTPSAIVTFNRTGATVTPTLYLRPLNSTRKLNTNVEIYRTIVSGTEFFFESYATPVNLANVETLSWKYEFGASTSSDTELQSHELLYTSGNELNNGELTASNGIIEFDNRLFFITKNGKQLQYTKTIQANVGVSPVEEFTVEFNGIIGDEERIIGGHAMDNNLIMFTENKILIMAGTGPDNTGNGSYSRISIIPSETGCIHRKSIVSVPQGLIFLGKRGFTLLSRNLTIEYFGAPLEQLLLGSNESTDSYVCDYAYIDAAQQEVIFGIQQSPYPQYVFDFQNKYWFTSTSTYRAAAGTYAVGTDLLVYPLSTGFAAHAPDNTATTGTGTREIKSTIETNWIQADGVEGYQRIYRMYIITRGELGDDFDLTVDFAYDFEDFSDTITVNTSIAKVVSGRYMQLEVYPSRQKCEAVKIRISDSNITNPATNRGLAISSLDLIVGVKNTNNKVAASAKTSTV